MQSRGFPARYVPVDHQAREEAKNARASAMLDSVRRAPKPGITMDGATSGPRPKSPADRKQAVRDLAMGEACQVQLREVCRRDTEHTVWAHTNTQGDQKGMGYKGHDSEGMFACDRCHEVIDRRLLPEPTLAEIIRAAKQRTLIRLRFIANAISERPWRVRAARWALDQLEARKT